MLRKFNAIISMATLFLLIIHMIMGSFSLIGVTDHGNRIMTIMSFIMLALVVIHIIIGTILTVKTIKLTKKSGASYPKQNRLFWTRRISGFAIILFVIFHLVIFGISHLGGGHVFVFAHAQLIFSILLVATVAVHVISNIKPLLISFGFRSGKVYVKDILFVMSIILLFATIAFIAFFIRFNFV